MNNKQFVRIETPWNSNSNGGIVDLEEFKKSSTLWTFTDMGIYIKVKTPFGEFKLIKEVTRE